ncbi:MAG TPA: hypothetical protein PK564_01250 [bacterium]|nr:hypothetical protein [bacterium]
MTHSIEEEKAMFYNITDFIKENLSYPCLSNALIFGLSLEISRHAKKNFSTANELVEQEMEKIKRLTKVYFPELPDEALYQFTPAPCLCECKNPKNRSHCETVMRNLFTFMGGNLQNPYLIEGLEFGIITLAINRAHEYENPEQELENILEWTEHALNDALLTNVFGIEDTKTKN